MAWAARLWVSALVAAVSAWLCVAHATAQTVGVIQSEILVINPERLFEETRLGQKMAREVQAERDKLIALNEKLTSELEAEEKTLTELRAETSPEEFREMADAFDLKVQQIRRDSERRVSDLERARDRAPVAFMLQVEPVLVEVMRDAGGVVILDHRSVLLRADFIDITDLAISRIDAAFDGTDDVAEDPETDAEQD